MSSSRWQYRVVNLGSYFSQDRLVAALGKLGAEGWQLVTVYDKASNWLQGFEKGFALFMKEVPDGEEPTGPWASSWSMTGSSPSQPDPSRGGSNFHDPPEDQRPGYKPDPSQPGRLRWWDGEAWLAETRDADSP